jgi:hypothetical protein
MLDLVFGVLDAVFKPLRPDANSSMSDPPPGDRAPKNTDMS